MIYQVIAITNESVTIWDGYTFDSKHRSEPAGQMELYVGAPQVFRVGCKVNLIIQLLSEAEAEYV